MKKIQLVILILGLGSVSSCEIKPKPGVYCDKAADCSAEKPNCDLEFNNCYSCKTTNRCASTVCQNDGKCADEATIVYVDNKNGSCTGVSHAGTKTDPVCQIVEGITKAQAASKPTVYVLGSATAYDAVEVTAAVATKVNVIGPGTKATPKATITKAGFAALNLKTNTNIALDLTFTGFDLTGVTGKAGVLCQGSDGPITLTLTDVNIHDSGDAGIDSTKCTISVQQTQVYNNQGLGITSAGGALTIQQVQVYQNRGGGVAVGAATNYAISNAIIYDNPGEGKTSVAPGVSLANGSSGTFTFNTVTNNYIPIGTGGLDCGSLGAPKLISNSIVTGNTRDGTSAQTGALCMLTNVVTGVGDSKGTAKDPTFIDPATNFRLKAGDSKNLDCCIDKISQSADLPTIDIDGTARPQPTNGKWDIGAHEVK